MWLCLNDAFLSVVKHRNKPGVLLVRARMDGDIEAVFPDADVQVTPDADYLYRAEIHATDVAAKISERLIDIEYDNFKNSVRDPEKLAAYHEIYHIMYQRQTFPGR